MHIYTVHTYIHTYLQISGFNAIRIYWFSFSQIQCGTYPSIVGAVRGTVFNKGRGLGLRSLYKGCPMPFYSVSMYYMRSVIFAPYN